MNFVSLLSTLGVQGFIQGAEYRAKCPLHRDNNPSFSMNIEKGLWICHAGCGSGEFVNLVERVLGLNNQEARAWVYSSGRDVGVEQLSARLSQELNPAPATKYLQEVGWLSYYESLVDNIMPLWFLERGFAWTTVNEWGIKFNPINDSITIPIHSEGRIVGTVTRNTKPELPKYQNSQDLPRAEILFGKLRSHDSIIICEGALDTVWLWQCDYNCAGLLGSTISQEQVRIITKLRYGEVVLALDNDDAGRKGTKDAVRKLSQAGYLLKQIKVIQFPPDVKDPQDCTPDLFGSLYESRKDILVVL